MFEKVDHVTIIVKDMDKAIKAYENILNLTSGNKGFTKTFGDTRLVMLTIAGARIELMQPGGGSDNPFSQFLTEHGEGIYSYCVQVFVQLARQLLYISRLVPLTHTPWY